jgi:hypothetical protein
MPKEHPLTVFFAFDHHGMKEGQRVQQFFVFVGPAAVVQLFVVQFVITCSQIRAQSFGWFIGHFQTIL